MTKARSTHRLPYLRDAGLAQAASFQRSIGADVRKAEDDTGLVEMSISSEAPYERWFGIEILSHSPDAVDLTRLADGRHPLLVGHDTERQVGVLKKAWLDADAKKVRVSARFSRAQYAQDIRADVEDEIRTLVSVGYYIEEIEESKKEADGTYTVVRTMTGDEFRRAMEQEHGADFYRAGPAAARKTGAEPPVYIVTRWVPFEASLVPVPADVTVGIGRAAAGAAASAPKPAQHQPLVIVEQRNMPEITKTPAELELERRDAIAALAEQYKTYLKPNDAVDAIRNGLPLEGFKDLIMQRLMTRHTDTSDVQIGMSQSERKRYSLGRALVAAITSDWSRAGLERECSLAVAKVLGREPEGFFVPPDMWRRDLNVGTASEAGNLVATDLRSDMFTDALRNALVLGRLGVTILPGLTGNVDLPRKSAAGSVGMTTEIGSASETAFTTTKATLSPKRISAYTEVSKQALIQAAMSLENMIRDDLLMGAADKLQDQVINGAGTGAEIRGLRNVTGIGTVSESSNGAAPSWATFVDLETVCANSNAEPDTRAGYLINTKTRGKAKQTQMGTNLPFIWQNGDQPVNGYRVGVTNHVPSNLTKGTSTTVASAAIFSADWPMTTIGLFGAPDITVDPFTKADTGQVKITLNQFADMQHRQPAAVAARSDLLSN